MKSRARLLGHSVHQMLVVFPLGLLGAAVIFDIVGIVSGSAGWFAISFWMMAAGLVGAALAAPFGLIDFIAIPRGTRARRIGAMHGIGNVAVVLLFLFSWLGREARAVAPDAESLILSFAGVALVMVTAWLGGELVSRLGVGVDEGAGLDAPSSLASRNAASMASKRA